MYNARLISVPNKKNDQKSKNTIFLWIVIMLIVTTSSACIPQKTSRKTIPSESDVRVLTVMAATSLTESFSELGSLFEIQNPGTAISFNFLGSQTLVNQLDQGADADVFASANQKYMNSAVESNRIEEGVAVPFARNRLVVIIPKSNPGGITSISDLAKPGIKLALADSAVPVGQYTLDFLEKANVDPSFSPTFKDDVLKNVVSLEDNVKTIVAKVTLGEVDAGIAYLTDSVMSGPDQIDVIEIPPDLNSIAEYFIAPIADRQNENLARVFIDLVLSPEGQQILARYGFEPLNP